MRNRETNIQSEKTLIDQLARRSHVGYLSLGLLEFMRNSVPPEVTIIRIKLADKPAAETPISAAGGVYEFRITGEVDNAAGNGVQILKKLEKALQSLPFISDAKVTKIPGETGESFLEFTLKVEMEV